MIEGTCDVRFARVREAFRENFSQHAEVGAAVAVHAGGRVVVDLWGGHCDAARTRPWREHTLVDVFSVGKGIATLIVLDAVSRGELELDAPVVRYWPKFGAADKSAITLRQVLAHRAGVPAIREPLPRGAGVDAQRMARALEQQEPWWQPGETHGYHVNTFGYLLNELLRRVSGDTIGRRIARELRASLGADMYLGLPESEFARTAEFQFAEWTPPDPAGLSELQLMRRNAYANPIDLSGAGTVNSSGWRQAEIPSANLHATARGVARVYAALVAGELLPASLLRDATIEHAQGVDRVLDRPSRFGLGFQLTQPERPLGPNATAFGHFGAGGSLGFCDPEAGIAFGYVMNAMGARWQNPRNRALVDSVYASL